MFHDGGHTRLNNATGSLYINNSSTNGSIRLNPKDGESGLIVRYEGAVQAYHSNTKRIETTSTGAIVTGILTVTGNMNVEGVLTYQDVTNIDSIGIVTARSDIRGGRNLNVTGISTFTGAIDANSTLEVAGIANFDSTVQVAEKIEHLGDTDTYLQFTTNTINLHSGGTTGLTVLDTSVRVPTKLGINGAAPQTPLDVIANGSGYAINIRGRSSDNIGELRFTSNNYGSLYGAITGGPTYLKFATGGTNRWYINSSGHFVPNSPGSYDIGSTSLEIGSIYLGVNKKVLCG